MPATITSGVNNTVNTSASDQLKVSLVDKVASLLMSCLVLVSATVCFLGAAFLLSKIPDASAPDPTQGGSTRFHRSSMSTKNHLIDLTDLPDSESWKETQSDHAPETLQLVSLIESDLAQVSESSEKESTRTLKGDVRANEGMDDGDGLFSVTNGDRWELRFSAKDKKSYVRQLSFIGIELGVYGAGRPIVEYASNLISSQPNYRSGSPSSENRTYFVSTGRTVLNGYDQQLLAQAGVDLLGRRPIKFLSHETEKKLVELELAYAHAKMGTSFPAHQILRTVFECRPALSGTEFEIVVVSQRYKSN